MVFNEISFLNDLNKIRYIALPSNPDNNYMLFSIDGVIYKYDLSTKELCFSFKASAYRAMQIYDDDHKILTCDSKIVKIWEFEGNNPDLITSLPIEDKIETFYAPTRKTDKGSYFYIGVFQEMTGFKVYNNKLSEHWYCRDQLQVTALDFTSNCEIVLVGTKNGGTHLYDVKAKKKISDVKNGSGKSVSHINILDDEFCCVSTDDPAVYICQINDGTREPYKLDTIDQKTVCMQTSSDRKTLLLGFENSTIEFWKYRTDKQDFKLLKQIKEDFKVFNIDPLCTSMLMLNPRCRDIEFHIIEWDWNTSMIDQDLQNINLDFENIDDDFKDDEPDKNSKISNVKNKQRSQTAC